jgi:aspartyl-tRNA(Asn)/glutamyl-tRNA(Gln) amidotransferase subunit B
MVNAIEFEISRQIESLSNGQIIENETRSFDPALKMTLTMRDKEAKQDYR